MIVFMFPVYSCYSHQLGKLCQSFQIPFDIFSNANYTKTLIFNHPPHLLNGILGKYKLILNISKYVNEDGTK